MPDRPLGQCLLASGQVSAEDIERALAYQARQPRERIGAILVRLGAVSEDNLLAALAEQTAYPVANLAGIAREQVDAALHRQGWPAALLLALRAVAWQDGRITLRASARASVRWQPAAAAE